MNADLTFAEKLAEQGYWIYPCYLRQKDARNILGRPWGWYFENNGKELLASLLGGQSITGAAISLDKDDPRPLIILDFDLDPMQDNSWAKIWSTIASGTPPPEGIGVTKTISGGYHLWFRLPRNVQLPDKFDFGSGIQGEVRASNRPKTFLMLPGSVAINKAGKPQKYEELVPIIIDELPEMPEHVLTKLQARPEQTKEHGPDGLPTEIIHFLEILSDCEIAEGQRNETISRTGQILGRIAPHTNMPDLMLEKAWDALGPKLGKFKQAEFIKALRSGFKTGKANAGKFLKRNPTPTVSDVKEECQTIFDGPMWMKKLIDSTGKCVGYNIGVGGSPKRPYEAETSIQLEELNMDDVLPYLAQAAKIPGNSVVTSPLFVQPGWKKVLQFILKSESTVEPLAIPPEDVFFEKLNAWAIAAAADARFVNGWAEKRTWDKGHPFFVYPRTGEDVCFSLPERSYERLLRQIGDIGQGQRLSKKWLMKKSLIGRAKVWVVAFESLEESTKLSIRRAYEKVIVSRKLGAR